MTELPVYHKNIKFANWSEWCTDNIYSVNRKKFTCWFVVWTSYILKNCTIFWMELRIPLIGYIVIWCPTTRVHSLHPNYYPPMKLREGNVFSRVCLSICPQGEGVVCDHYPWCIGLNCSRPLPIVDMGLHCERLLPLYRLPSAALSQLVLTTNPFTVGKWSVCTILQCFLGYMGSMFPITLEIFLYLIACMAIVTLNERCDLNFGVYSMNAKVNITPTLSD